MRLYVSPGRLLYSVCPGVLTAIYLLNSVDIHVARAINYQAMYKRKPASEGNMHKGSFLTPLLIPHAPAYEAGHYGAHELLPHFACTCMYVKVTGNRIKTFMPKIS